MIILSLLFVFMCLAVFALGIALVYNKCFIRGLIVLSLSSVLSGMAVFIIASIM